jgi:O-antigen ligase
LLIGGAFFVSMPSGYGDRVFTILHTDQDQTNSAQERRELLERGLDVIVHHPIVGVGVGNYSCYSIRSLVAHNSYIEIAAELGLLGLAAYLVLIFAPLRSLRRIEKQTYRTADREMYYVSIGLQAVITSYAVCSFFQSAQYTWYLYYLVAYAVSLRLIRAGEPVSASPDSVPLGRLWAR